LWGLFRDRYRRTLINRFCWATIETLGCMEVSGCPFILIASLL
jgi:hypothetical protein